MASLVCESERDGDECAEGNSKELFLVVETDGTGYKDYHVYCWGCIENNDWSKGTLMFRIGDDATNFFL